MLTHEELEDLKLSADWQVKSSQAKSSTDKSTANNEVLSFDKEAGLSISQDLDDSVKQNEMLQRLLTAKAQVEAANRLRDDLLSMVSHELRTPLTTIVGWAQMMLSGKLDADMMHQGLETIYRNAQLQNQMISNLVDASRLMSGQLKLETQPVLPTLVVSSAIELVAATAAAKQIIIDQQVKSEVHPVLADSRRLQQVLFNVLNNAIKFTRKNGKVQIIVQNTDSDVEILVSDNGIGIKPEMLTRIFEQYEVGNERISGSVRTSRLGLSVAKQLIEMHGGSIRAESAGENEGATFIIKLPALVKESNSVADAVKVEALLSTEWENYVCQSKRLDGAKLLLVDDDNDSLELLTLLFYRSGATVETAHSTAEAVAKYREFNPDLLISDIGMSGDDGYALIQQIRQMAISDDGQKPAIALTALTRSEDRQRALAAGFQCHIKKPAAPAELVENVSQLLQDWH